MLPSRLARAPVSLRWCAGVSDLLGRRFASAFSGFTQNPALAQFTAAQANLADDDDLFVLGRNILQAAEGTAGGAVSFIEDFVAKTARMIPGKQKSILNGILFEIFFDSNGGFRRSMKDRYFNESFNLQRFGQLAPSFTFITDALQPFANRFHVAPPGRGHPVAIDLQLLDEPPGALDQVVLGGINLLRAEDEDYLNGEKVYRAIARTDFEDQLYRQLLIPRRDLTLTYGVGGAPVAVRMPWGFTAAPPPPAG